MTYIFLGSEQPNFEMRTGGLIETLTGAQILITACVLILMVIALLKAVWRNSDTIRMAAKRVWSDFLRFTRN
ncbi:hypothetical protein [Roseibium polysiphoniae]|uniref:hypothetical protein n=1 Tax=Roseibium polysiphoniae TaxID=2571221 RepID=UPI0032969E3B